METRMLPISQVFPNIGQVKGLDKNPRFIRNEKYKKLVQSIKDDPEMLELRELIVYDTDNPDTGYVVIGGNMRYRAMKELGYKEVPCKVLHPGFPVEKMRRIVLKDNSGFGEWDFESLVNEWAIEEIDLAAIDIPDLGEALEDDHTPTQEPTPQEESTVKEDDDFEQDDVEEDDRIKEGDLWHIGRHKLFCGDCTKKENVQRLFPNGELCDLWLTDPPYGVNYGEKKAYMDGKNGKDIDEIKDSYIENDELHDENLQEFLVAAFEPAKMVMKPGASYYIFHSDSYGYYFRGALIEIGDMDLRENLIWNKNSLVLSRQDYHWKHEPCQPAGTMVLTVDGEKPIETLTEKDRVIAFNPLRAQVLGYKNGGYAIKTASRDYSGEMYTVKVDEKETRATDNHMFSVRFNAQAKKNYCTYLMRRGDWWRVGITKAYDSRQFGLKTRFHQEKAEEMWLLGIYPDKLEAQVAEQVLAVKYGIPYTIWEFDRFSNCQSRSKEQIQKIYESLDLSLMKENALRLLHDFGRNERFPLINETTKSERFSTRVTAKINACNLVPEIMQIPVPREPSAHHNFEYVTISEITHQYFEGKVYSLAVEQHEHYISDGIITHNCLYGWKAGAGHNWYADRKQSTVIDWDRPTKSLEHPTMKPVGLFGYLIKNSSKKGDIVYDGFGGSGTTMVAAEQLGRSARLCELMPHYCKVILFRMIKLRGYYYDIVRENADGSKTKIDEIFDKEELNSLIVKE